MMSASKYAKRLNIFLFLNDENNTHCLNSMLEEFCKENLCTYKVHPSSVVKRFFYIECYSNATPLSKLHEDIENIILNKASNIITWYKIEIIEVK